MGFWGDVAKDAIKTTVIETIAESKPGRAIAGIAVAAPLAAINAASNGIEKLEEISKNKKENNKEREKESFFKKVQSNPEKRYLMLNEYVEKTKKPNAGIAHYSFYDGTGNNLMYVAAGRKDSKSQKITINDMGGNKVAEITEKMLAIRNPLSFEGYPADFDIEIDGKKQGKVQSKGAVKKRLEVKFKGWSVYQKASGSDRMEDEAGNTIAEMTDLKYNSGTFIEYDPSIDDRLMMTLSLVIRAYNKSVERRAH